MKTKTSQRHKPVTDDNNKKTSDVKKSKTSTDKDTTDNKINIKRENKINIKHEYGYLKVEIKDAKQNEVAMVSCSRFISITNSSDYRRV